MRTMSRVKFARLAAIAFLAGCAALPPRPPPPTTQEIIAMAEQGTPAPEIIARIDAAQAVYRLSASGLAKLREQGVPDAVIDHMQTTWLDAVRREEAWRQHDMYLTPGWPYRPLVHSPWWWRR